MNFGEIMFNMASYASLVLKIKNMILVFLHELLK
jgi:hypothetical protein